MMMQTASCLISCLVPFAVFLVRCCSLSSCFVLMLHGLRLALNVRVDQSFVFVFVFSIVAQCFSMPMVGVRTQYSVHWLYGLTGALGFTALGSWLLILGALETIPIFCARNCFSCFPCLELHVCSVHSCYVPSSVLLVTGLKPPALCSCNMLLHNASCSVYWSPSSVSCLYSELLLFSLGSLCSKFSMFFLGSVPITVPLQRPQEHSPTLQKH